METLFKFIQSKDAKFITDSYANFVSAIKKKHKLKDECIRHVCLIDFTKYGTLTRECLDWAVGIGGTIAHQAASSSCVLIIAPWFASEQVEDGLDGERKRIELKCKARNLKTFPITFYGSRELLGNRSNRPLFYPAWLAFPAGTENPKAAEANVFLKSPLHVDRGNASPFLMSPETDFLCPESGKLSAAENESIRVRGVGYSRNITGGASFANALRLSVTIPGDGSRHLMSFSDISPCQGHMQAETYRANVAAAKGPPGPMWSSFAASFDTKMVDLAKKTTKTAIFESWRQGENDSLLGVDPNKAERHEAEPPGVVGRASYPTLMALTGSATDNSLYMPEALLQRWSQDAIRLPKLRLQAEELLRAFPAQTTGGTIPALSSRSRESQNVREAFPNETLKKRSDVSDMSVWAEYASLSPGVAFLVLKESNESAGPGKGFLVCKSVPASVGTDSFLLGYHAGGWIRGRASRARREEVDKADSTMVICQWTSLQDDKQRVVIESRSNGGDAAPRCWAEAIISLCETDPIAQQNMTELSIDGHKCCAVGTENECAVSVAVTTPEQYVLVCKEDCIFVPDRISQDAIPISAQTTGSYIPRRLLEASPALEKVWRVLYKPQSQDITMRKPLWFLAGSLSFTEVGEMVRIW